MRDEARNSLTQSFYCVKCHRITTLKTLQDVQSYVSPEDDDVKIAIKRPNIQVKCMPCKEFMVEVDSGMISYIVNFNKLGFMTTACCEGHYRGIDPDCYIDIGFAGSVPYVILHDNDKGYLKEVATSLSNVAKFSNIEIEENFGGEDPTRFRISLDTNKYTAAEYTSDLFQSLKIEFFMFLDELMGHLKSKLGVED